MTAMSHQPDGPPAVLAGPGFATALKRMFLATRPAFFTASVLPVLVGTAWAAVALGHFDGWLFALALLATVLAHAATNVYNDVGDDVIGADAANSGRIYPYTGGSRFIQTGLVSRADMARLAFGLAVGALAVGALLTWLRGPSVLVLGLIGLGLGILYSMPGPQLSARGIGEAAVATGLGLLPVIGASWLQSGQIDAGAVIVALPVSAWVAAILLINEVPDMESDGRAGKRTLVVRRGVGGARVIYIGLAALAASAGAAAIVLRMLPTWYAVPGAVLAILGIRAAFGMSLQPADRPRLKKSIELTLAIHALGCIALIAAIVSRRFL
jgi:1,4-dihydroxy-2-naphthoate octaprenyltransferase